MFTSERVRYHSPSRVVEAVHERLVGHRARALRLVGLAHSLARVLDRVEPAGRAASDVVHGPHGAGPQQREAVVGDAAGVDDVAVEVAEQARMRSPRAGARAASRRPSSRSGRCRSGRRSRRRRWTMAAGRSTVDHVLAVERGAPGEDVELADGAAGAAHVRQHGHVAVVDVRRRGRPACRSAPAAAARSRPRGGRPASCPRRSRTRSPTSRRRRGTGGLRAAGRAPSR